MKIIIPFALILFLTINLFAQTYNDAALARVVEQDKTSRDASGKLLTLTAAEHAFRGDVYSTNRQFGQAREHWQKILDNYRKDSSVMPKTLFGIARSYMWERQYEKAVYHFEELIFTYADTKEGREGLAFKGASLVRLGKNAEAAKTYEQYVTMFPNGEKIETSYLNIIDALREAGDYKAANLWVDKTRQRFAGLPAAANALNARLRMEIFRENWQKAVEAADALRSFGKFSGSMTSLDEVTYLKAFALEKLNRQSEAANTYSVISKGINSYYGGLAADKLEKLNKDSSKVERMTTGINRDLTREFPVQYRAELIRHSKSRGIDPRFVLAIMKQESGFRAGAKSSAAARGLLQLVFDTALKYNKQAGFVRFAAEDLYQPNVNIAIGSVYIAELKNQFGGLYEAIAASYNGGEDNAGRWLARSKPKESAIFASEIGFAETKNYVFKVMNNYRVYRQLYTEDLTIKQIK